VIEAIVGLFYKVSRIHAIFQQRKSIGPGLYHRKIQGWQKRNSLIGFVKIVCLVDVTKNGYSTACGNPKTGPKG